MAEQVSTIVKDYDKLFDPEWYLKTYYSCLSSQEDLMPFLLKGFHDAFASGSVKGARLLDVGTGPSICSVISATPYVQDISLSDYTQGNLDTLKTWRDGSGKHSFKPFFEQYLKLEHNEKSCTEREAELRSKIKTILKLDLLQPSIFQDTDIGMFDIVTSSLCLEAVATDIQSYVDICKKISKYVTPNGLLVLVGVLQQTFYIVSGHRFYTLYLTKEDIVKSWGEAGFSVTRWEEESVPPPEENPFSDYGGGFVMEARKDITQV